jgi:hypothetical protein
MHLSGWLMRCLLPVTADVPSSQLLRRTAMHQPAHFCSCTQVAQLQASPGKLQASLEHHPGAAPLAGLLVLMLMLVTMLLVVLNVGA